MFSLFWDLNQGPIDPSASSLPTRPWFKPQSNLKHSFERILCQSSSSNKYFIFRFPKKYPECGDFPRIYLTAIDFVYLGFAKYFKISGYAASGRDNMLWRNIFIKTGCTSRFATVAVHI